MNQPGSHVRNLNYVTKEDSAIKEDSALTKGCSIDSDKDSLVSSTSSTLDKPEKAQHNTTDITQSQEEVDSDEEKMSSISIGMPTASTTLTSPELYVGFQTYFTLIQDEGKAWTTKKNQ